MTICPVPPCGCEGRERELDELRELAGRSRAITLCGPAGSGKTQLLHALASAVAGCYPDGVCVADLGDLRHPSPVAARVAAVAGIAEEPGVPVAQTLARALRDRRMVLALDSCEQVAAACGWLCERLIAAVPGLLVLTASRVPLGLGAEAVWPVPPLTVPAAGETDPARASQSGAVRLFTARAAAAAPGFALDPGNCAAVATICAALDGLPLAIELAAAQVRGAAVGQVAADLAARLPAAGEPELMRAAVEWSISVLSPDEQVLLRRLSVFASWSLETAERVCADDRLPATRMHALLTTLTARSLVTVAPGEGGPRRYRLPGAVREAACTRLAAAGEADTQRLRLRDYVLHLAEYLLCIGTSQVPASWPSLRRVFRSYDADAGNIRAVLSWCLEHGDVEAGLRICTAIRLCWLVRGTLDEGAAWLDALLDADVPGVEPTIRGQALVSRAQLAFYAGDRKRADAWAAAGLELCQSDEDTRLAATALDLLSRTALSAGRAAEALQLADAALELTRQSRDPFTRGFALGSQAFALAALGRREEARATNEAGLALMLELDNQWGVTLFRLGLGDLARGAGDLDTARWHYLAALPFLRDGMPAAETAKCLARLGSISLKQGDHAQARQYLADSLRLSITRGTQAGAARALHAFAALTAAEGRPDRAVLLAGAVAALREAAGLRAYQGRRARWYQAAAGGLGDAETDRLWAAGLELSTDDAIALAVEPPGEAIRYS